MGKILKIFIIAFILLLAINGQEFLYSHDDVVKEIKKYPERVSAIMVTAKENCKRCQQANPEFFAFQAETQGYINTFAVDCDEILKRNNKFDLERFFICAPEKREMLPHITFFSPKYNTLTGQFDVPDEEIYSGYVSADHFLDYSSKRIINFGVRIQNKQQWTEFLDDKSFMKKVVLFTEDENPLIFRGLGAQYRKKLQFAEVDFDEFSSLRKKYKIKKSPTLMVLQWNEEKLKFQQYVLKEEFEYNSAQKFLDRFAQDSQLISRNIQDEFFEPLIQDKEQENKITFDKLERALQNEQQWVAIHIIGDKESHKKYFQFKNTYKNLFTYYELDCKLRECKLFIKEQLKSSEFPQLLVYPLGHKEFTKGIRVNVDQDFNELSNKLLTYIKSFEPEATQENYRDLVGKAFRDNQFPVLWFYESSKPTDRLLIQTISSFPQYQKHLKFLRMPDPNMNTRSSHGVGVVPYVVVYTEEKFTLAGSTLEKELYNQDELEYLYLIDYLNKLYLRKLEEVISKDPIKDANNQEKFEELCTHKNQPCVIALLDTIDEDLKQQSLETLDQVRKQFKHKSLSWLWIDGYCHAEVLKHFKIQEKQLPTLVYYDAKKAKYQVLKEQFELQEMQLFIKGFEKKKKYQSLDQDLDLDEHDCNKIISQKRDSYWQQKGQRDVISDL